MFYNWTDYLEKNFNEFKNNVIEEMINYYGEEYKKEIIERLDRVNFIFYGNTIMCIPLRHQSKYEKQNIIYTTKCFEYSYLTKSIIKELINVCSISHATIYDYNNDSLNHFILFPLYSTDKSLIHEMIHAITTSPLALIDNKKYISKTGLQIASGNDRDNGESLLEESITEIEANIIYMNLKDKDIKPFIRDFDLNKCEYGCYYDNFIPFISDFYDNFFEDITYSRITLNKNHLFKVISKSEYNEFINNIDCFEKELIKKNYKVKKLV